MSKRKTSLIPSIVCAALFGVAAIVFIILGAIEKLDYDRATTFFVIGGICGAAALLMAVFAVAMAVKLKKKDKNFGNPNSVAYKVMGPNTKFTHFAVIPNADSQSARNATVNVLGAVGAVFLGFGMFTWGKDSLDAFVSEDEFIISSKNNANFDDDKFTCYRATDIETIMFSTVKKYERLEIAFTDNRGVLVLDIDTSVYPAESVRGSFSKLLVTKARLNGSQNNNVLTDSAQSVGEQTAKPSVFEEFPNNEK